MSRSWSLLVFLNMGRWSFQGTLFQIPYCLIIKTSILCDVMFSWLCIIIWAEDCWGLHFGFSLVLKGNKYIVFVNCCDFKIQIYFAHILSFKAGWFFSYFWLLKTLVLPECMLRKELGRSRGIQMRI